MANGDFSATVPPEPTAEELARIETVPSVIPAPETIEPAVEAEEDNQDEFEDEENEDDDLFEEAQEYIPEGASVVTLRTTTGKTFHVSVPDGTTRTVRELIASANLTTGIELEIWLDGAQITLDTPVPAGRTLTLVGSVKGG